MGGVWGRVLLQAEPTENPLGDSTLDVLNVFLVKAVDLGQPHRGLARDLARVANESHLEALVLSQLAAAVPLCARV